MVFEALSEAIAKLDEPDGLDAGELAAAFALRDRLDAWVTAAVGAFDRDECYALEGAVSVTAWIHGECRQTAGDAKCSAETARKLRSLPHVATAWRNGDIGSGHVRAVCAIVPNRHLDAFATCEAVMVSAFASLSVHDTTNVLRKWVAAADDADPDPDPDEPADTLHVSETLDGRRVLNGHLSPDNGIEVEQALRLAAADDPDVPMSQRNADAFVDICRFYNNHHTKAAGRRNRPHLNIVVRENDEGEPVGQTLGGIPVSPSRLKQWLCDCLVQRLTIAGNHILNYGIPTPTIPIPLWQAVAIRDRTCRFPGCNRPISWCECHHVHHREHGGPTAITNLVMMCSKHHHLLHTPDWNASIEPDGTLHVTGPDGRTRTTYPPGLHDTLWPPGTATG